MRRQIPRFLFVPHDYPGPGDGRRWCRYVPGTPAKPYREPVDTVEGGTHVVSQHLIDEWARVLAEIAQRRQETSPGSAGALEAQAITRSPERPLLIRMDMHPPAVRKARARKISTPVGVGVDSVRQPDETAPVPGNPQLDLGL